MSNGQLSINEMLSEAMQAEDKGVPVDWKAMCYRVVNAATNHIANLQDNLARLEERTRDNKGR